MKLINIIFFSSIFLLTTSLFANTNPVVTNVFFTIDNSTVTVTYDVADAEDNIFTIYMEVSENSGTDCNFNYGIATGDIGENITEGTNKIITWAYNGSRSSTMKIKILADDLFGDQIYYTRKIYNTVTIGNQIWLKENLNIGRMIINDRDHPGAQQKNNGIIEKYCKNNDEANCDTHGGLYEWNEAMQYVKTVGAQGICPSEWHIPTKEEYIILQSYVNGEATRLIDISQIMEKGLVATNTSGFSALFSGIRYYKGYFGSSNTAYFWSSTEGYINGQIKRAYRIRVRAFTNKIGLYDDGEIFGFSIRCLKN